jgi:ubiquinone/menaquinone biosynthesis C-methylase UbiE
VGVRGNESQVEPLVVQKDRTRMLRYWNSTAEWRDTYFVELCKQNPYHLSACIRMEREFVIAEEHRVCAEVARAESVLELGCGVGRSLLPVIKAYPTKRFVGIDLASQQIARFAALLKAQGHQNAEALVADVAELPIRTDSIDLVLICHQTFGTFLGQTRDSALDEIVRVLRPRGRLYIGGFDNIGVAEAWYRARGVDIESIQPERRFVCLRDYNSWWQSERDIVATLAQYGFYLCRASRVQMGFLDTFERKPGGERSSGICR